MLVAELYAPMVSRPHRRREHVLNTLSGVEGHGVIRGVDGRYRWRSEMYRLHLENIESYREFSDARLHELLLEVPFALQALEAAMNRLATVEDAVVGAGGWVWDASLVVALDAAAAEVAWRADWLEAVVGQLSQWWWHVAEDADAWMLEAA